MSKVTKQTEEFNIAFGVDSVVGVFITITDKRLSDENKNYVVLDIDRMGISHRAKLTEPQKALINVYEEAFKEFKSKKMIFDLRYRDILKILETFGVPKSAKLTNEVRRLLD
jgi:hypothetical protein